MTTDPVHLTCAACGAVNRLPAARLADGPNCGKCRTPLFSRRPIELDAASFARTIARSDIPIVVDFWADWCGPCKMMAPHFAAAAAAMEPRVRFAKLDTEAAPEIAAGFAIRSIPTVIVFKNGAEIARRSGAMDARTLQAWLEPYASA